MYKIAYLRSHIFIEALDHYLAGPQCIFAETTALLLFLEVFIGDIKDDWHFYARLYPSSFAIFFFDSFLLSAVSSQKLVVDDSAQ